MSGGSYDYAFTRIDDLAGEIRSEGSCSAATPALRKAFASHLRKVALAAKAIEWNDSGDGDDEETALILAVVGPHGELEQATRDAKAAKDALEAVLARAQDGKP